MPFFCIPCLLFTDPVLRGEHVRFNQGNAFTNGGFHSWKKQHSSVLKHEASSAHRNAVIAQAVFSKEQLYVYLYMYTILCHLHVKMTVTISDKLHATCAHQRRVRHNATD